MLLHSERFEGVRTRRRKAALALGMGLLLIPGRWASGADAHAPAGVESTSSDEAPAPVATPPIESPNELEWRRRRIADALLQIEGAGFYEAVGRPDLAERYETRRPLKTAGRVTGGAVLAAGFLVLVVIAVGITGTCDSPCAPGSTPTPSFVVPDFMMLGGLMLLLLPTVFETDPVNEHEKLGLAEAEAAVRARSPGHPANLSIAPRLEHDGAALTLSVRF